MVFAFPGPVVMPSSFCLPLHSGALSLAWDLGHFTACVAQRLLDPSVHPPPHQPPGGLWGLGEPRQMVFVCWGKRLSSRNKGKQESLLWESTYVPGPGKSRPGFLGGSGWGTRGMGEVAPWTSLLWPLGIPGSFPKEFLVCVFLPSATNCHSPDQTFPLS